MILLLFLSVKIVFKSFVFFLESFLFPPVIFFSCLSSVILAYSFIFKNESLEKLSKSFEYIGKTCQLAE